MDFVRYIAYISECEPDVSVAKTLMIDERDRRLIGKDQYKEKDKRLKDGDVKAIYECHYKGRFQTLREKDWVHREDDNSQEHRRKTSQYQSHAGKKTISSTWDSGESRTSEGSSSGSSTPLLHSIHVMQPGIFDDSGTSRKRREITGGHVSPRPRKCMKPLTASAQVKELQQASSSRVETYLSGLQNVSSGHLSPPRVVEDEAWEDDVIGQCVPREKTSADAAALLDAQSLRESLELGKRSLSCHRDLSRPTISPLSDGPAEQPASKPTTRMSTRRDPLHHMLDKMTTGFTDNLFFLHGILRTHADVDTARARGQALDAAAADLLESINAFRRSVEVISEGNIERQALAPPKSTPATPDRPSEHPAPAGEKTLHCVFEEHVIWVYPRNGEKGYWLARSPKEQDVETTMRKGSPKLRAAPVSRKPGSEKTGAIAVPDGGFRDPLEELFSNPWSTETG